MNSRDTWNLVYYITAGIYCFGAIIFLLLADASPQSWGVPQTITNSHNEEKDERKESVNEMNGIKVIISKCD